MPGNEYGERIHNFFGQEGLSQDQHQSPVADGSWSGFSNGLVGNQRQLDPSLITNLKSYSTQHSVDPERGQSSNTQHGLNFTQQPTRSEYSRSLFQEHQQPTNGYMHGNLMLQASPNDANFMGVDAESSRDSLSARAIPSELPKIPMRFEMGESPVNYDFFGGQQQLNSQLPGMVQPLPRQQMTFNDLQLLKQQVMVKQMHDYQMQQQLQKQQLEARRLNSLNSNVVNGSRSSDNQSHHLINGIPLQEASSNWQPDRMTGNTSWMHRGISPIGQSSSSGIMITPEHGQANLMTQQFTPSFYGMPVSGANAPQNDFSSVQMNRVVAQHGSANRSSPLTNQPTAFLNQADVHDSHMLPRSTYQEKPLFSHPSGPGSNKNPSFERSRQDDFRERNISVQEKFGQIEDSDPPEKTFMKVPENKNALQKSTALDPTEEKILFGSDDNLWEAFGNSTDMNLTGNLMSSSSDLFDACPSLQSGSWSALMQSAVAETPSEEAGIHEWGHKQQSVWADNSTTPHANSHIGMKASNTLTEKVHSDSTRTAVQHLQDGGNKVYDNGVLEKPMAQRSQMAGNFVHSSSAGKEGQNNSSSIRKNEGIEDRLGIWKAASNPYLAALKEQKNHFSQNLQMQGESYGFSTACAGNDFRASRDGQGNIHQPFDINSVEKATPQLKSKDGSQILESYASNTTKSNEMVTARDLTMLPGRNETLSGHVGSRPSTPRKFQYHPMGNIDVTNDPCRAKVSHFEQSRFLGQPAMNLQIDKGHASPNDLNCANEAFKGMGSENSPSTSASADRSVDRHSQVKSASPRQTMLDLLHKVDQSEDRSLETNVSEILEAKTSVDYSGQFQHSQSSASQGFSLQLAPPSQPAPSHDNSQFSRNSLQPLNSLHTAPEKGGTSQSRCAPWASNHSLAQQQSPYQGPLPGISGEMNVASGFPYSRGYHPNQLMPVMPVFTRQSADNHDSSSEMSTSQVKERYECSDIDQRGHSATHNNKEDSAEGLPVLSATQPMVASSSSQQTFSSGMMPLSQTGISAPQHRFWNQPCKPQPEVFQSHTFPNNIEGSFSRQEKINQILSQNEGDMSLSGRDKVNTHELQTKNMSAKQTSDVASVFSKMVQSNLHTSDRSHPSNNLPMDNLRHDEHMAGSGEGDLPKLSVKRFEDSAVDAQNVALKGEQRLPSKSDGLVRGGLNHKESTNHMLHLGQTSFPKKNYLALAGADHQQISPQMAPSWYSQYGTFKNGLVQPMNDTRRFTPLKIGEQSSNVGSSVDAAHSVQLSKQFKMQQMSGSPQGAETPSSESLPHGATEQILKVDKPKKRKTATSGLLSWNIEVMQGPQRLQTFSEAEVDWARSSNRFAEKVEFETLLDDVLPVRSKRRLIYTTQLVQQLFRPPPARVISLVASSNYEFSVYIAARAVLGDACSSTPTDRTESLLPPNNSVPSSERTKTEKISDQYISKAAEDFISRTGKLESDFERLEKGTTIADLSVDVQDLEKFAVINRFARFHPTSSSMDRTMNSLTLNPQRYVSIAPMPRNIPDRVQCLSL